MTKKRAKSAGCISCFVIDSAFVIRHYMKPLACGAFLLVAGLANAGLDKYSSFVVADKDPGSALPSNTVRVTYLGVNGFQLETNGHALLVDPYFTRVGLLSAALNQPIQSNSNRVAEGLKHVRPRVDAILVTHAHFDHLLDAPEIIRRTHGKLISGPTAVRLVESLGISPNECDIVKSGSVRKVGPWTIRVLAAQHDRLFGKIPFEKCRSNQPSPQSSPSRGRGSRAAAGKGEILTKQPVKVSDWCVGESLAFVIEAAGKQIYIDSGGVPGAPPDSRIKDVDLAILGVALPDSRDRFAEAVRKLRPRYILPSHQDDMFASINRGFTFGKMTNFPTLLHEQGREKLSGRLILLDYFRPWTLR
jgi:L-ascorbate metabolism protein UlaG (beta-lactamase superfamily)